MAKLSHIDDFEDAGQDREKEGGASAVAGGGAAAEKGANRERDKAKARATAPARAQAKAAAPELKTASDERDYHGLDEHGMGGGQKFIAVVSFVVLVAVVLYILNYWLHFV
jgi:hypothetical protein